MPLRHWRKQLIPNAGKSGTPDNHMVPRMGVPSASVVVKNGGTGIGCPDAQCGGLTTEVFQTSCSVPVVASGLAGGPGCPGYETYDRCVSFKPAAKMIRSGLARTTRDYCFTTSQYLRQRGMSIDQCNAFAPESIDSVDSDCPFDKSPITSAADATRVLSSAGTCRTSCGANGRIERVYKPSNRSFACQGGVSSSSVTQRRKIEALYGGARTYCPGSGVNRPQAAAAQLAGASNSVGMLWKFGSRIDCQIVHNKTAC